jgi:hypothetical protein
LDDRYRDDRPLGTVWFRAKLSGANLTNIKFSHYPPYVWSILWDADLTNAEMRGARLNWVYLDGSDMTGANFRDEQGRDLPSWVEQRYDVIWRDVTCPDGSKSGGAACEPLGEWRPPRPWPWAVAAAAQPPTADTPDRRVNALFVDEQVTA